MKIRAFNIARFLSLTGYPRPGGSWPTIFWSHEDAVRVDVLIAALQVPLALVLVEMTPGERAQKISETILWPEQSMSEDSGWSNAFCVCARVPWEYTGLFPSLWFFFENTITPSFYHGIVWIFGILHINVLSTTVFFIIFFKILTISGQKKQICRRTLKFFANFYEALMNLQVFM